MMKKLVILLACLGLAYQTGCTSKDSQSDSEVTADYDSADLEKLEGDEALEIASDDSLASDQLPEDALGETTTTTETTTMTAESSIGDDQATTEQVDVATNTETLPADPFAESTTTDVATSTPDTSTTIVDAPSTTEDNTSMVESTTSVSSTTVDETYEAPKKASVPLQKVASTPWKASGTWFNTVYFARPGDSLSGISQMIYGADRTSELRKGNPTFNSRDVKPGDKVYYNSPHRPDDAGKIITYYEDNGMAPEVYVAKSGDNIRSVSKNLLGYDNAWKEVWSSNSVDSKGGIAEGTELRFWKGGAVAAAPAQAPHQELAGMEAQAPSMPAPPQEEYPQQAQGEIPPPPMEQPNMDMAPPPPPPMDMAQNDMAPPPPPPIEAINPPAPPQMAEEAPQGMDNDTTMALGVVGIAAAGLAILIVMRKKRKQRELDQQMDHTHVGT